MKYIKKFDTLNEKKKEEDVEKIEKWIEKNKKNKSSYEMYKQLRDMGYKENDLNDYFYDNY